MKAHTVIVIDEEDGYRASCRCGWTGILQDGWDGMPNSLRDAKDDAKIHLRRERLNAARSF